MDGYRTRAAAAREVKQLSGSSFAPCARRGAAERLVSAVCYIIGAAKRH